jgi:hypothetical protein
MKYAIIIFVALIAHGCSIAQFVSFYGTIQKGKVRSYSEISYSAESRFGEIEKGERERTGRMQFRGVPDHMIKYDDNGNQIEENRYKSDGSLESMWTSEYEYDDKGNVIEKNRYGSYGWFWTSEYEYDDNENLVEEKDSNSEGVLESKTTYEYDDNENLIEEKEYIFDKDGNPIVDSEHSYKYDDNGNLIGEMFFDCCELRNTISYKYDDNGNLIGEMFFDCCEILLLNNAYDDKGNQIEMIEYDTSYSYYQETYKYEFDKLGNWIKKIVFSRYEDDSRGNTAPESFYYLDLDGDGYGSENNWKWAVNAPPGYVSDNTDSDDNEASIHPNTHEIEEERYIGEQIFILEREYEYFD